MLTGIQHRILKAIASGEPNGRNGKAYEKDSKLEILLGREFLSRISGKTVIDFGCGEGSEAIEMARKGAKRVVGIDIREDVLQTARQNAMAAGLSETCEFTSSTNEVADTIVSIDA